MARVGCGRAELPGITYASGLRDSRRRLNDDEQVTVTPGRLPAEVAMLLFVITQREEAKVAEKDCEHGWWRLLEAETGQQFAGDSLLTSVGPPLGAPSAAAEGGEEGGAAPAAKGPVYLIVGRLFKQEQPPPPARPSTITPSQSPAPPAVLDQGPDPVMHSAFVMQSASLVASVAPVLAPLGGPNTTRGAAESGVAEGAAGETTELNVTKEPAVPTLSSVQPVPGSDWYFESLRHKVEGAAPPELPEIGLPGEIEEGVTPVDGAPAAAGDAGASPARPPTSAREGGADWLEQIGRLVSRIQMTPMPMWQRGDGLDQESAFGGKSAKGKKGGKKGDKKGKKRGGKKGSEVAETPIDDSSHLDLLSPPPPEDDDHTKFLKRMAPVPGTVLGPFDLDCAIDEPPATPALHSSFIAQASASVHDSVAEEAAPAFPGLVRAALEDSKASEMGLLEQHGYSVEVNGRSLERGKQVLKHGFDLQRLTVLPVAPPPPALDLEAAVGKLEVTQEEAAE